MLRKMSQLREGSFHLEIAGKPAQESGDTVNKSWIRSLVTKSSEGWVSFHFWGLELHNRQHEFDLSSASHFLWSALQVSQYQETGLWGEMHSLQQVSELRLDLFLVENSLPFFL